MLPLFTKLHPEYVDKDLVAEPVQYCGLVLMLILIHACCRDIGIDDSRELRDLLTPVADESLRALLGMSNQPQQQQLLSGAPLPLVS